MDNLVAERIQARMEELGKNPSSVALEAGLGRSSVRDILLGRVANPRIDTLKKIAAPLKCTVDYLTGESEKPDGVSVERKYWFMDGLVANCLRTRSDPVGKRPIIDCLRLALGKHHLKFDRLKFFVGHNLSSSVDGLISGRKRPLPQVMEVPSILGLTEKRRYG